MRHTARGRVHRVTRPNLQPFGYGSFVFLMYPKTALRGRNQDGVGSGGATQSCNITHTRTVRQSWSVDTVSHQFLLLPPTWRAVKKRRTIPPNKAPRSQTTHKELYRPEGRISRRQLPAAAQPAVVYSSALKSQANTSSPHNMCVRCGRPRNLKNFAPQLGTFLLPTR